MINSLVSALENILKINSPTGFTENVIKHIEDLFSGRDGLLIKKTNKGSLMISFSEDPRLIITGHIDTLGAMVKEIKSNGTLEITMLGSYPLNSFEGEYVTVRNSDGKLFRGTFLLNNPASHVNRNVNSEKREQNNMSIRLDEEVNAKDDVLKLGIDVGDFIFYDNRFERTESGFIKS
jgi:putative aminopeptidase FrvX